MDSAIAHLPFATRNAGPTLAGRKRPNRELSGSAWALAGKIAQQLVSHRLGAGQSQFVVVERTSNFIGMADQHDRTYRSCCAPTLEDERNKALPYPGVVKWPETRFTEIESFQTLINNECAQSDKCCWHLVFHAWLARSCWQLRLP
jgi:hypothetical protein